MKIPNALVFALVTSFAATAPAFSAWKPAGDRMLTPWGEKLNPKSVWPEYPRPLLERQEWTNLNGLWNYAVTSKDAPPPTNWTGEILIPFALEAPLSGVGRILEPNEALWYKRSLPPAKPGLRSILHFEAVDYDTTVWVNGKQVGTHRGGNTPFEFDITDALKPSGNALVLKVLDATEEFQLNGKQRIRNEGIFYTRVSGIWQTVWLEHVAPRHFDSLAFAADIKTGVVTVTPKLSGPAVAGETVKVAAGFGGKEVASAAGAGPLALKIPAAKLWSPDAPNIYDLIVQLVDGNGRVIDIARSYVALREVGKVRDANGNLRFTLNGKPIFHWGPLDQGWWPDGLLTPPSDEAMVSDIKFLKAAGFNMIRKHIKIEPRRYYTYCDRLGMMLWQDQVSGGPSPRWTRFDRNPEDADANWTEEAKQQWVVEYKRMVDLLRENPSIVVWTVFNEAWGQHSSIEMGKMAIDYDRTRSINIASGGNFWEIGDIADEHRYPDPGFPFEKRYDDYIKVVGEFGGHGWPVSGHIWNRNANNWGYGGLPKSLDEWKDRYARSVAVLCGLRGQGVAAAVYTQTTDVEGEINGLLTYDRLPKAPAAWFRTLSDQLLASPDVVKMTALLPSAREKAVAWRYSTNEPAAGWEKANFNDQGWKSGPAGFGTAFTPNTHVGTEWNGADIWVRTTFTVPAGATGKPVLRIYHDEEADVFINGVKVFSLGGNTADYVDLPILQANVLKPGTNVIAIHCHQTEGGQYIDAGVYLQSAAP